MARAVAARALSVRAAVISCPLLIQEHISLRVLIGTMRNDSITLFMGMLIGVVTDLRVV